MSFFEPIQVTQHVPAANLLVIDDERAVREGCRDAAQSMGYHAFSADSAETAYKILEVESIDVVLLDLRLPGIGGLEALQHIKARRPDAIVIIITGYASVHSAVQAMKLGAYDYMTKPFSLSELKMTLEHVAEQIKSNTERRVMREKLRSQHGFGPIIGQSPEMEKLYRIISKAAQSTHPVLVLGESGTGKELVARSIHLAGPTKDKPFLSIDCSSMVPTSIESELFGYVRGAFTGATRSKEGLLSLAEGGTLFMDEVGELPLELQSKIVQGIHDKEIHPLGSTRKVPINVRILASTNRDLEAAVAEGRFRRDLYYRLNILTLRIPPLRERRQDIPLLATHFLERMEQIAGLRRVLSDEATAMLMSYEWPGNVRELETCIERACTISSGPVVHVSDLSSAVQKSRVQTVTPRLSTSGIIPIAELEKQAILHTIDQLNGDKLAAARMLGIGKTTLYRKLKEYGIPQN